MKLKSFLSNQNYIGIILIPFFLIIYSLTLSPSLNFIDSGELAAACATLGIAHPTGYPLFTILGFLFSKIPIFGNEIYRLNFLSAVYCTAGLFLFYKSFMLMSLFNNTTKHEKSKPEQNKKGKKPIKQDDKIKFGTEIIIIAGLFAAVTLGLSNNYWEQSTQIEVYPLHCLFLGLLLLIFTKNIYYYRLNSGKNIPSKENKNWFIFAFILGLAFTNHMSTIFTLPGFFYFFFATYGYRKSSYIKMLKMLIPFIIGLMLYLYFPIRASQNPEINWGNPQTLEYFKWHITGRQYQVWVFSSLAEAAKQFKYFINTVPKDFLYFPVTFGFFGLIYLFKNSRQIFYFTLILFLTCMLLAINYSIHDIDSYFLLSYFILALWSGFGVLFLFTYIKKNYSQISEKFYYFTLLLPALCLLNFSEVDESKNYLVHDYTLNILNSVEPNSIVISFQWDNWVSASYYFQHVKNIRKDIVIIDKELLRRSWYFNQLNTNYPWIVERSKSEIDEFLKELYKFEHDLPYDPDAIQSRYINLINSIVNKNISSHPVYLGHEIEKEIGISYKKVPEGLLYRLYSDDLYHDFPIKEYKFTPSNKKGRLIDALLQFYGVMFTNRANYEAVYGFKERASWYLKRALEINPSFAPAMNLKRTIENK